MQMSTLRIAPLLSCDPDLLRDLMRSRAAAGDGLEHLQVRAGPQGVQVFAFFRAATPPEAETRLRRIVEATIATAPELHNWRVV